MKLFETIKKRSIFTIILLCIASITFMGVFAYHSQKAQLQDSLKDMARNESGLFNSIIASDAEGLARAHIGLDRMDPLLRLFAAGKREELLATALPVYREIKQENNITHIYFIRNDGTVFLRVHKPEQYGDKLARATFLKASTTGKLASGLEMGKNFFSLRCVKPVSYQGKTIGFMEVAEEIDHVFMQMRQINGNDVSLFMTDEFLKSQDTSVTSEKAGDFRVLYPTNKDSALLLANALKVSMKEALREPVVRVAGIGGRRYAVGMAPIQDAFGNTVGILFSQKDITPLYAAMWKGIAVNILIFVTVVLFFVCLFYLSMRRSLALFEDLKAHVLSVTTDWDLTKSLEVNTRDEIGELANDFNLMTGNLAAMVERVSQSGTALNRVSADIRMVSGKVTSSAEQQFKSVNETSSAITQINSSIVGVSESVDALSVLAAESASSILELTASNDEVAMNTESLSLLVAEVTSSIGEMTASIKQVGENAVRLMESAHVTSSSIEEMDRSIKQVEQNAVDTATLSEDVRRDAEIGKEAVDVTIAGISAIKDSSRITSDAITMLSGRARDIGNILTVIDEITAQTSLLALNAAIIAAQAGEHGKGFAVVAAEIGELAERTNNSTREIAEVVKGVQNETGRAVKAIRLAEMNIAEGETLSRKSGEALNKIVAEAQMAREQVASIARATAEQAKESQMIRRAMEQVSSMVGQIAAATREQGIGGDLIIGAVEKMKCATEQVKNSTREQSKAGSFIVTATETITAKIRQIKQASDEQRRGSEQIMPAVENIKQATESNLDAVKTLDETLRDLASHTNKLCDEISRFNVRDLG
ncbi:MAG TPA: methyl-accepting chemotaxis protein [Geobacteraceae bacterium]